MKSPNGAVAVTKSKDRSRTGDPHYIDGDGPAYVAGEGDLSTDDGPQGGKLAVSGDSPPPVRENKSEAPAAS